MLADLEAVMRLERAAETAPHWSEREYARLLGGGESKGWPEQVGPARCLLVAEHAGAVEGFAVVAVVAGEAELESVAVRAEVRRRGVGRALCEGALAWAVRVGAPVVRLEVRAGSAGARALYESLGFVACGVRPGYYSAPADDAVLYTWAAGTGPVAAGGNV